MKWEGKVTHAELQEIKKAATSGSSYRTPTGDWFGQIFMYNSQLSHSDLYNVEIKGRPKTPADITRDLQKTLAMITEQRAAISKKR